MVSVSSPYRPPLNAQGVTRAVPLTLSGGLITDAVRNAGLSGDGRIGDQTTGIWPAATNLCTNGAFTTNTTGWAAGGTNTIARVTTASAGITPMFGANVLKCTYVDNTSLALFGITLTAAAYIGQLRIWIPTAYDGVALRLSWTNYVGATVGGVNLDMSKRDQWQKITPTITPVGGDLIGELNLFENSTVPTVGRFVYVNGCGIETGSVATPYIETDGATTSRTAGRVQVPWDAGLFTPSQMWVAGLFRMGWSNASAVPVTAPTLFTLSSTANERLILFTGIAGATFRRTHGGSSTNDSSVTGATWAAGDYQFFFAAVTAGQIKGACNGAVFDASIATNTQAPVITTSALMDFGNNTDATDRPMAADCIWEAVGSGQVSNTDSSRLYNAYGKSTSPKPTLRGLINLISPSHPTLLFDGRTGIAQRRVAA